MKKYLDGMKAILDIHRSVRMLFRDSLIFTVILGGMRLLSMMGLAHFSRENSCVSLPGNCTACSPHTRS
jgi:hypothetical protein